LLQADIDLMSGTLHAEDKDYKTAYSYFFEAFEGLNTLEDPRAINTLKYMILCKIMTNSTDEIYQLLNGKHGLNYAGTHLEAMRAITKTHSEKSLVRFRDVLTQYD